LALRAAADPLHLMAAEALGNLGTLAEGLQERVYQLEAIATLIVETIRNMKRAAAEAERASACAQ
jgi:hypothetical protein